MVIRDFGHSAGFSGAPIHAGQLQDGLPIAPYRLWYREQIV